MRKEIPNALKTLDSESNSEFDKSLWRFFMWGRGATLVHTPKKLLSVRDNLILDVITFVLWNALRTRWLRHQLVANVQYSSNFDYIEFLPLSPRKCFRHVPKDEGSAGRGAENIDSMGGRPRSTTHRHKKIIQSVFVHQLQLAGWMGIKVLKYLKVLRQT